MWWDPIFGLLLLLWQGFELVGAALIGLIIAIFGSVNLVIPDWIIELGTIGILLFLVFKYGKFLGKLLLAVLLLLLASSLWQLLI